MILRKNRHLLLIKMRNSQILFTMSPKIQSLSHLKDPCLLEKVPKPTHLCLYQIPTVKILLHSQLFKTHKVQIMIVMIRLTLITNLMKVESSMLRNNHILVTYCMRCPLRRQRLQILQIL